MVGIQSCYDFKVCRVIFPKPLGLGPVTYNVIWFILFQIYQNLKKIQRVLHNPSCIILLCEQFLFTDTEILRILALQTLSAA
jgi:hypothetical protein